jgi:hypothetical protein
VVVGELMSTEQESEDCACTYIDAGWDRRPQYEKRPDNGLNVR